MKRSSYYIINIFLFLLLFAAVYRTNEISNWNMWVNRVMIAGQTGSSEMDVASILGKPTEIRSPKSIGSGFLPRPPQYTEAVKVYVYKKVFFGTGGYWVAYVYIDKVGQVTAVHIAES